MPSQNFRFILPMLLPLVILPVLYAGGRENPESTRTLAVVASSEIWGELAPCG